VNFCNSKSKQSTAVSRLNNIKNKNKKKNMTKNDKTNADDDTAAGATIATTTTGTTTTTTMDPGTVADATDPNVANNPTIVTPADVADPNAPNMTDLVRQLAMNTPADPAARIRYFLNVESMLSRMDPYGAGFANGAQPPAAAPPTAGTTPVSSNVFVPTNAPPSFLGGFGARTSYNPYAAPTPAAQPGTQGSADDRSSFDSYLRAGTPVSVETLLTDDDADTAAKPKSKPTASAKPPPITFNTATTPPLGNRLTNAEISTPFRSPTNVGNTNPNTGHQEPAAPPSVSRPDIASIFNIPVRDKPPTRDMIQQINDIEEFAPDIEEDLASLYGHTFATRLAMDPKVRESRRIASRKGTTTALKHVDPIDLSRITAEASGPIGNVDIVLFQLLSKIDEFGWQYLFNIVKCESVETPGLPPAMAINMPPIVVNMLENHGYRDLEAKTVRQWVLFLHHFSSEEQDEKQMIKEDLQDSYTMILNSCDAQLRTQVEDEIRTNRTTYKSYHKTGPVALMLALEFVTMQSDGDERALVNMMAGLKLTNIQGENIPFLMGQYRTVMHRIRNDARNSEYFDIILDALNTCTVEKFKSDLQAWCSVRDITRSITDKKNPHDLMQFAVSRYNDMAPKGKWLPTSKGKSTYFTPAAKGNAEAKPKADTNAKKKEKGKKDNQQKSPAPTTPSTPSSGESKSKKRDGFPKWRTTPPVNGETTKQNASKTRTFKWCSECDLWGNHDDSTHLDKAQLAAQRAAKGSNVSFSNGNIASSPAWLARLVLPTVLEAMFASWAFMSSILFWCPIMTLCFMFRTVWAMQVCFNNGVLYVPAASTSSTADKTLKAIHNLVRKSLFWPVYKAIFDIYSPTLPFRFLLLLLWWTKSEGGRIGRRRPVPYGFPAAWMILSSVMLHPYAISCIAWGCHLRSSVIDGISPFLQQDRAHGWSPDACGQVQSSTPCADTYPCAAPSACRLGATDGVPPISTIGQRSTAPLARSELVRQHSTQCTADGRTRPSFLTTGSVPSTGHRTSYLQRSFQRFQCYFTCWMPTVLSARKEDPTFEFSLVADTGSSFSLTPYDSDLIFTLAEGQLGEVSTVENRKMPLSKLGYAEYFITTTDGREVPIYPIVFVIPGTQQRLLSPQDYFETLNIPSTDDAYGGSNRYFWLRLNADGDIAGTHIDPVSNLPHFRVRTRKPSDPPRTFEPQALDIRSRETPCACNLTGNTCECVLSPFNVPTPVAGHVYNTAYEDTNAQLSPAQRHLLLWHHRLGHRGFIHTQRLFTACDLSRGSPFNTTDCTPCLPVPSGISKNVIATCQPPLCLSCELANAHRRGPEVTATSKVPNTDLCLQTDDLSPGDCVSLDHYECPQRGRLLHTYGKEPHHLKYCGGLILADHASGYVRVFHQVSLGTSDTLLSKTAFEQHCLEAGVRIKSFHTDNGTFTSRQFRDELARSGQTITFSGTGAHHQNGVAERAIRTVTAMSRAMMIHMEQHWPDEANTDLWPLAMDYATWLYNHTPRRETNMAPIEIFTSTKLGCKHIQRAKVFGSPAFVLDPRLQDGRKIPKWDPRSARGQFLGFSQEHSSTVALVRNINTGSITPQYHVVHDEMFSTVTVSAEVIAHPGAWMDFAFRNRQHYLDDDDTADFPAPTLDENLPSIHPDFAPAGS
jgi:hypothetical protein